MRHRFCCPWLLLAPIVLLAAACDGHAGPTALSVEIPARDGAPLQTDALDYTLRYAGHTQYVGRAVVTYQNAGSTPLYLNRLSEVARVPLFVLVAAWTGSYDVPTSQVFIGTGVPALVLMPGAMRVDTLEMRLHDLDQPGAEPRLVGRSGVLRVRIEAYTRVNHFGEIDASVPKTELVSNPFRVQLAR